MEKRWVAVAVYIILVTLAVTFTNRTGLTGYVVAGPVYGEQVWDFSEPGDYSYNEDAIKISGGKVTLKKDNPPNYASSGWIETADIEISELNRWDSLVSETKLDGESIEFYYSVDSGDSWQLIDDFNLSFVDSDIIKIRAVLLSSGSDTPVLNSITIGYLTQVECQEDWECGDWEECQEDNTQVRTCTDLNGCGTEDEKPETEQDCEFGSCSASEVEIQAANEEGAPITGLPEGNSIYLKYRSDGQTQTVQFEGSNDFKLCVPEASDSIYARSCGPSECSGYSYIEATLGDDISVLDGVVKFITTSVVFQDQDGMIDASHEFYGILFLNVYRSSKLVFGCGNCNNAADALKAGDSFVVPLGAGYSYKSMVKTSLSNYNGIESPLTEVDSASEDTITSEFLLVSLDLNDQDGSIDSSHEFYSNAYVNVYSSSGKLAFGCGNCNSGSNALQDGDTFIVPSGSSYSYKPLVKTGLSNYNSIEGDMVKIQEASEDSISPVFRVVSAELSDQYGPISEGHKFFNETFINVYSSNEKLAFGCGNCNSKTDQLKSQQAFFVPDGSDFKYRPLVKTDVSNYNNIDGGLVEMESFSEESVSSTLRTVAVSFRDSDGLISGESAEDLYLDILKTSNNKVLWSNLKPGASFIVPDSVDYYSQEQTDPAGNYNDLTGTYNLQDSTGQDELDALFQQITIMTYDAGCAETDEAVRIIRPSNGKTVYQLSAGETFHAPIGSEMKYQIVEGELLGPVNVSPSLEYLHIAPSQDITCPQGDVCVENWTSVSGVCTVDDTRLLHYLDANACGTTTGLPADNGTHVDCDYCTPDWSPVFGECMSDDTMPKIYTDNNDCGESDGLPVDNGTHSDCDFCTPEWTQINTSCTNNTIIGWFNDSNTCFAITGLESDNEAPENNTYACQEAAPIIETVRMRNITKHEVPNVGKVDFNRTISINESVNIDYNIRFTNNSVFVDSIAVPELNTSATLTLFNQTVTNPTIMRDGETCPGDICQIISYINGTVIFNVTHFTTYSVEEGPYCGDSSCDDGESCSTCPVDCGACPTSGGSSSGGGGGGGGGGSSGGGGSGGIVQAVNKTIQNKTGSSSIPSKKQPKKIEMSAADVPNHPECDYKLEVLIPEEMDFLDQDAHSGTVANRGNCEIDHLSLSLNRELGEVIEFIPPIIEDLGVGETVDIWVMRRVQAGNLLTGQVIKTAKYNEVINGNVIFEASSGEAQILKKEVALNVIVSSEKRIFDRSLAVMMGLMAVTIIGALALIYKHGTKARDRRKKRHHKK
ncbi:MAG: hypothetical protein KJ709_07090 [Nanoarchaeota archaeon]|nr:hypothetical protein [Nanoarchaeota archaeon]